MRAIPLVILGLCCQLGLRAEGAPLISQVMDSSGDGLGNPLDEPRDLVMDSAGNVYVAGYESDNVFRITPGGAVTMVIGPDGDGSGNAMNGPEQLVVDGLGNVYVLARLSHNVFKLTGGSVTEIFDEPAIVNNPPPNKSLSMSADSSGTLYLVVTCDGVIHKRTVSGTVSVFFAVTSNPNNPGCTGPNHAPCDGPAHVYVDHLDDDRVYVMELITPPPGFGCLSYGDFNSTIYYGPPLGVAYHDFTGLPYRAQDSAGRFYPDAHTVIEPTLDRFVDDVGTIHVYGTPGIGGGGALGDDFLIFNNAIYDVGSVNPSVFKRVMYFPGTSSPADSALIIDNLADDGVGGRSLTGTLNLAASAQSTLYVSGSNSDNVFKIASLPVCGNNSIEGLQTGGTGALWEEECDGTDDTRCPGQCSSWCTCPHCPDLLVEAGEECDLNNDSACYEVCQSDCTCPVCGDGDVEGNEQCDNGASNSNTTPDSCRTDCSNAHCGDGVRDAGEVCDGLDASACAIACGSDCLCAQRRFVNASATGTNNGLSWANAYVNLQSALQEATLGTVKEIWVARGTYYPAACCNAAVSFSLAEGLKIYGGFLGNETDVAQRDPKRNVTILSGDMGGDGNPTNNSRLVVLADNRTSATVLDGFVIEAGNHPGMGSPDDASGLRAIGGTPTVRNCVFRNNRADLSSVVWVAGGEFSGCVFENNNTKDAALMVLEGSANIHECVFRNHQGVTSASALNLVLSPGSQVTNCLFHDNSSESAAILVDGGSATITNCTITENSGSNVGGGIWVASAVVSITNSVLWGNTDLGGAFMDELSQLKRSGPNAPTVTYTLIQGLTIYASGTGNIGVNPGFENAAGNDFHLSPTSPCVEAGSNAAATSFGDLEGNVRIMDGNSDTFAIVDLGAFEGPVTANVPDSTAVFVDLGGAGTAEPTQNGTVSFENMSGGPASVSVTQLVSGFPAGIPAFGVVGPTVVVEPSIPNGQFQMRVTAPFDASALGSLWQNVDLKWFNGTFWELAVTSNTQNSPGHGTPIGDRLVESGTSLSPLSSLSSDLGDYGVSLNTITLQAFVWANVDHASAFAAAQPLPDPPLAALPPHDRRKNRYVSFVPNGGITSVAHRVDKVGNPSGSCWVGAPDATGNAKCMAAPVFRVWPEPVIHAGDCEIIPVASYEIRSTTDNVVFSVPLTVDTIAEPVLNFKKWGDVVGVNSGSEWTPPNMFTNVNDVLAVLANITNAAIKPTFQQANLQATSSADPCLNSFVNVADVLILVKAVAGDAYPFTVNPAACPVCP